MAEECTAGVSMSGVDSSLLAMARRACRRQKATETGSVKRGVLAVGCLE